jgi:hypothetical protein
VLFKLSTVGPLSAGPNSAKHYFWYYRPPLICLPAGSLILRRDVVETRPSEDFAVSSTIVVACGFGNTGGGNRVRAAAENEAVLTVFRAAADQIDDAGKIEPGVAGLCEPLVDFAGMAAEPSLDVD